jgi:hypothetical protein
MPSMLHSVQWLKSIVDRRAGAASGRARHLMILEAPRAWLRGVCFCALALLFGLSACSGGNHSVRQLAAPAGVTPYSGEGALATAAHLAMADLHSRLRTHYTPSWDIQRYAVPANSSWDSITAHYSQALGGDWKVDTRYSEDAGPGYRSRVWSDGQHAVAIGLIEGRPPGAEQVLTVMVPEDSSS